MTQIAENLEKLNERIRRAGEKAGREPGGVTLVGVTKNRSVEEIVQALDAGLEHIGENRLQEAAEKIPLLGERGRRHFIGHLQRNKVKDVLGLFDLIQSVDSPRLAREIDKRARAAGMRVPVLMQVNTSGEESKFGVEAEEAEALLEVMAGLPGLELRGLMTIGLLSDDTAAVARGFSELRKLYEKFGESPPENCRMEILSMGMSADFEIAIAEGANMVRVGTAIFGPRRY